MYYMLNAYTKLVEGDNGAVIIKTDTKESIDLNINDFNILKSILSNECTTLLNDLDFFKILLERKFIIKSSKKINIDQFKYFDFNLEKNGLISFKLSKLIIEFDGRCSLDCKFCNPEDRTSFASCSCKRSNTKIYKYDLKELVGYIKRFSVEKIMIIGGDPFVYSYERVSEFLDLLKDEEYSGEIVINSNLAYWENKHFEKLSLFSNVRINIIMFGFNESDYNIITNTKKVFRRVTDNIKKVKKYRINANITVLLNDIIILSAQESMKLSEFGLPIGYKYIYNEKYTNSLILNDFTKRLMTVDYYQCQLLEKTNCCLYSQFFLSSDFKIYPCPSLRDFCLGDLEKESFTSIIQRKEYKKFWFLSKNKIENCDKCKYRLQCYDCRGVEYTVTKNLLKEHYCSIAHHLG